jgi:hypothetical protein
VYLEAVEYTILSFVIVADPRRKELGKVYRSFPYYVELDMER